MLRSERLLQFGLLLIGVSLCVQQLAGQSQPAIANGQPQPEAILVDGQPALSLDYGDGMGFLIVYTKFHDKPAFRFSISHVIVSVHGLGLGSVGTYECGGFLWVAKDEIAYTSDPAADQKKCVRSHWGSGGEFDLPRLQFTNTENYGDGVYYLHVAQKSQNVTKWGFPAIFAHHVAPSEHPHANALSKSPAAEEPRNAAKLAGFWLQAAFNNFPDAEKKFLQIPLPLTADQASTIRSAEAAADDAEHAGNPKAAFDTYVAALTSLPANVTGEQVDSLRQHLFNIAPKLNPRPAIPDEAQRYFFGSQAALQEWKDKGDPAKLDDAIDQLKEALHIAPWWPEAYFNRGLLLESKERYADAVESLKLYMLAAPNASNATEVKHKIYMLEYKAKEGDSRP